MAQMFARYEVRRIGLALRQRPKHGVWTDELQLRDKSVASARSWFTTSN